MTVSWHDMEPRVRKRAVGVEQKEARRNHILRAAFDLLDRTRYEDISMNAVAREARLAKGTLYLYFKTKEEVFLALATELIAKEFNRIDARLLDQPAPAEIEDVAGILKSMVSRADRKTRLMAILHGVLERNVSFDAGLAFKHLLRRRLTYTGLLLEERLPFLKDGEGVEVLLTLHALGVGFMQMVANSDVGTRVLDTPGMDIFRISPETMMGSAALRLLEGMQAAAARTPNRHR